MSFLENLFYSLKKSKRLSKLQRQIARDLDFEGDLVSQVMDKGPEKALEEYLDLCTEDKNIKHVMDTNNLSKDDLKKTYWTLMAAGGGTWIKGHYVALSTIAYYEPLVYCIAAKKRGLSDLEMVNSLYDYWSNKFKQGELLASVNPP